MKHFLLFLRAAKHWKYCSNIPFSIIQYSEPSSKQTVMVLSIYRQWIRFTFEACSVAWCKITCLFVCVPIEKQSGIQWKVTINLSFLKAKRKKGKVSTFKELFQALSIAIVPRESSPTMLVLSYGHWYCLGLEQNAFSVSRIETILAAIYEHGLGWNVL